MSEKRIGRVDRYDTVLAGGLTCKGGEAGKSARVDRNCTRRVQACWKTGSAGPAGGRGVPGRTLSPPAIPPGPYNGAHGRASFRMRLLYFVPMGNWLADIRAKLADRTLQGVAASPDHRRAGVLVPLYVKERELWLLFTKRSDKLLNHRGQVSFPGGAHETGDRDLKDMAVRETEEELGLERKQIVLLGRLSPIVTNTNFYVEPYVAAIPYPVELKPSPDEIEALWEIPISALMAPTAVEERNFEGHEKPVLFYHYGQKTVWGATARILSELLDVMAGEAS